MYLTRVLRATSPYNKSIKWFSQGISPETNAIFSMGFKTQREARKDAERYNLIAIFNKGSVWLDPRYDKKIWNNKRFLIN